MNNAGAGAILPLADVTADAITGIFAVNTLGPSLLARAALPTSKRPRARIVNISSTFGLRRAQASAHYAAGKRRARTPRHVAGHLSWRPGASV